MCIGGLDARPDDVVYRCLIQRRLRAGLRIIRHFIVVCLGRASQQKLCRTRLREEERPGQKVSTPALTFNAEGQLSQWTGTATVVAKDSHDT